MFLLTEIISIYNENDERCATFCQDCILLFQVYGDAIKHRKFKTTSHNLDLFRLIWKSVSMTYIYACISEVQQNNVFVFFM